jgi:hypothetical protein
VLALPFGEEVVTIGDEPPRGTTVGLTVDFLAAGRGQELLAEARDHRTLVPSGLVTFKLG